MVMPTLPRHRSFLEKVRRASLPEANEPSFLLRNNENGSEKTTRLRESEHVQELNLEYGKKRICSECGKNEVYRDIKTMDLCELCLWKLVQNEKER